MRDDDETADRVDADGLPLDPVKRRAAVEAQFDDFKARLATLAEGTSLDESPTADADPDQQADLQADRTRRIDAMQADLLDALNRHLPTTREIRRAALVEVLADVVLDDARTDPRAIPDVLASLEDRLGRTPPRHLH